MYALIVLLAVPLFFLNMLGSVIGGVWLLVLGEWEIVLMGWAWAGLGPLVLSLLILPVIGAAFAADRARGVVGVFLVTIAVALLGALMIASSVFLFDFARDAAQTAGQPILPFLLLAYGAAASPWATMTRGGGWRGAGDSFLPLMGVQVSAASIGLTLFLYPEADLVLLAQVGASAFVGAVVLVLLAAALERPKAY